MKITIDENYIRASKVREVRGLAKEFKNNYTEQDLVRAFTEATGEDVWGDVIVCNCECFEVMPMGIDDPELSVRVEMFLYNCIDMFKITFYANASLEVKADDLLWSVERYRKQ